MFNFDGGAPPWTSGLSQGTAVQLLARAYSRFHEAAYLTAAQQALGIFRTPPPAGRPGRRRRRGGALRAVLLRALAIASSTASSSRWWGSTTTPR